VELFKSGRLIEFLREHDAPANSEDLLTPVERLVLRMLDEVQ
jgi:DNA topoisomerase-1